MYGLKKCLLPVLLLFISACDGSILDESSLGYFEATFEDTIWRGTAHAIDSPIGFSISGIKGDAQSGNYSEIAFTINNFSGKGAYQILGDESWVGSIIGGDGRSVYLRGLNVEENKLMVNRYDEVSRMLEGRFVFQSRHANNPGDTILVSGQLFATIERRGWTE